MPDLWMDVDTALAEVPVNIMPLLDDTDFKTREVAIAYDAAGMDLVWNFVTTGGAFTQTAVTPTTAGNYDWAHQGDGMYTIEIPASGGASINNDTEGFGWFTGVVTGVLPWRGPIIGFRAAAINNSLVDGATLDVNVTAMANDVITATAIADNAIDAGAIAANAITSAKIATDAIGAAQLAADAIGASEFAQAAADKIWSSTTRTLTALGASLVQEIWDRATSALTTAGSIGKLIVDNLNATVGSRATQTSVDTIDDFLDTEVAAILEDTGTTIPAQISALNNLSAAQVNTEVDTALADARLDELLAADSDIDGLAPPAVGSVFHELMSKTAGSFTFDQTTDSLEAIRDKETDIETDTQDIQSKIGTPAGVSVSADIADIEGKVDDLETRLGTPSDLGSGATVAANLVDIEAQTDDIGAAGAGLTAIPSVGAVTGAVGSVTGNVGGNVTGSVGSVTAGVTISDSGMSATLLHKIADRILRRSLASAESSSDGDTLSFRSLVGAISKLVNRVAISGSTLTVYRTDDSTSLGTQAVTTDAAADPVTEVNTN